MLSRIILFTALLLITSNVLPSAVKNFDTVLCFKQVGLEQKAIMADKNDSEPEKQIQKPMIFSVKHNA